MAVASEQRKGMIRRMFWVLIESTKCWKSTCILGLFLLLLLFVSIYSPICRKSKSEKSRKLKKHPIRKYYATHSHVQKRIEYKKPHWMLSTFNLQWIPISVDDLSFFFLLFCLKEWKEMEKVRMNGRGG